MLENSHRPQSNVEAGRGEEKAKEFGFASKRLGDRDLMTRNQKGGGALSRIAQRACIKLHCNGAWRLAESRAGCATW